MAMAAQTLTPPSPTMPLVTPPPGLEAMAWPQAEATKPKAPLMPPPGLAKQWDSFAVNFALLADSDDEDELDEVVPPSTKGRRGSGAPSVCGKISAGDASTCAGFSDDGTASSAGSDHATSYPATP